MFRCEICEEKAGDKCFRLFITYEWGKGKRIRQIRLCDKCLEKKDINNEIEI